MGKRYLAKDFTNEEKLKLIMAKNQWATDDLNGKIESVVVSDGPIGIRKTLDPTNWGGKINPSVAYPSAQCEAMTFNTELIYKMGKAIANDCISSNVDVLLGPGNNIKRNPLCGRNFEYYSEDPYLSGNMAKSFILGVQSSNVGACLKHYCANNNEYGRNWMSSEVDNRTLREIYLKTFQIALEAKPWTIMSSYNLVNGVRMSENKYLYDILRNDLHFDGMIISDWEAVQSDVGALNASLDLEFPYCKEHDINRLQLLKQGKIDLNKLDEAAQNVLNLVSKNEEAKKNRKIDLSLEERNNIAYDVAKESAVLLKNDMNLLPINNKELSILATGVGLDYYTSGGGSSQVVPNIEFEPFNKILSEYGYKVDHVSLIKNVVGGQCCIDNVPLACKKAKDADVLILGLGDDETNEREERDRMNILLPGEQVEVLRYLRQFAKKIIVVIFGGSVFDLKEVDKLADAILYVGYPGQKGNKAIADIITGSVNPSGRLAETFAMNLEDYPVFKARKDYKSFYYDEGIDVGYRYFLTKGVKVLYPFGYGLSYSKFEYENLNVSKIDEDTFEISLTVKNISDIDGKDVVQLYISNIDKKNYVPLRELKGFEKVFVKAHDKVFVSFKLSKDDLKHYINDEWIINSDKYYINIGRNCEDIVLEAKLKMED